MASFSDSLKAAVVSNSSTADSSNLSNNSYDKKSIELQESNTNAMSLLDNDESNNPEIYTMSLSDDDSYIVYSMNESWTEDKDNYRWFNEYQDNNYSIVNDEKNIALNSKQFNITQEENSQFIPFEMPRYYDGIDLTNTTISIHYTRNDGKHGASSPVNVSYNDEKIRFAWLADASVTGVSGKLKFEIHADGAIIDSNGNSYGYTLKTKSNEDLNVLQSLCDVSDCGGTIDIDETWVQELVSDVAEKIAQQIANAQIGTQVEQAEAAAERAETAANNAESTVENILDSKNYATETYVKEEIAKVDVTDQLTDYATISYVDNAIDAIPEPDLSDYALKTEIPTKVSELANDSGYLTEHQDLSAYALKSEVPSIEGLATEEYVDSAIAAADLDNYYKKNETYSATEIDEKLENVSVDLSGYYTKTEVDSTTNNLSSSIDTNITNISSLSNTLTELQTTVNGIDTSPRLTYDVKYNDTEDADVGENVFVLYEIENEGKEDEIKSAKAKFTIVGGSGGSSTSSVLKIEYVTKTPLVVTLNDKVIITYNFSGTDSSGDPVLEGVATWKVGSTIVATNTIASGENSFDITDYISTGTQKVTLSITDDAGSLVTKNWTIQKIDVRIESTFNDKLTYDIGTVSFDYTPYGAVSKDVHFILDGVEIGTVNTTSSGIPMSYILPSQTHGSHLLDVYMTTEINNNSIESNHIVKDIIWYDSSSDVPVIGCVQQEFTARQYDTTNIVYTVYDPTTENPEVILAVDGDVVSTLTLDNNTQTWQYKSSDIGEHTLTITCGSTVKTLKVTIEKLDIDVSPVTAGLAFDFNPVGKSNNDTDRLWTDGTTSMTVSDNFDWVNGGYQIDDAGDQYFCIKAGTSATIDYKLFEDDAKRNGKEFKLIFKTTNVRKADATFLSCLDGTIGLQMNVHEAYVNASAESLYLPYSEEDVIEFEFNINKDTDEIPMVIGYEDGVSTRPMIYSDSHNFTQDNPQVITIGSDDCDVYIYRMKAYSSSLTDRGILNNFIADARSANEMINRYNRNQIYDENGQLTAEILAEKCPQLRIIKIEAPHFTNNKTDKVTNTTIQYIYKNGDPILDNWKAYNCQHAGQGTTSNEYGAAGRNLDLIMNKSGIDGVTPYIILGDGTEVKKVSLTRDSVEVAYFNVKVNIASSENENNALLQRRFNTYNPYLRPARTADSKVKDTMEFYNCVVFIKESDTDVSTHREFQDTEWHFYAIGNIGDSKKTDNTRLNDPDDPLECIVEIMDNTFPNSTFPTGVTDSNGNQVYPISASQWKAGNTAYDNLYADQFDEKMTYGWRYSYDDSDSSVTDACIEKWREFYTFVVTSTDEEFKANLKDYFVVDTALFDYLFTTRYTMIDNRAKNTFWHYGKCEDGVYRWDLCFDYDNDSALGINNSGELTMTYGYEDTDYKTKGDASTGYAFNAATSTFFCRIRDLFVDELCSMFVDRESAGAWSAEGLINQFDTAQAEFPEELWRLDIERKYIRSYKEGSPRFLTTMMQGRKKYQRRQFERNQEKYMATKFFGNVAVADQIMFRCNTPTNNVVVEPNYTLHLTPYADMYLSVMFGATYRTQIRAEAGTEYNIECPFTTMDDTAVLIYGASRIQGIGDLSACYIHDNDFSKGEKLQILIIGNETEGYTNPFLTTLNIGNNPLLKKLDIQNTPNLAQALDLSSCNNLEELYAYGSGLTGVTFSSGGKIQIAQLPAITSITMRKLLYLTNLDIVSLDNMVTAIIEDCDTIDVKNFVETATNLNRVRITGIDWTLEDTSLLKKIYSMKGIDKNGYNISQSVLTGKVHVPVIRQQELYEYQEVWNDLEITYDSIIEQYAVTFVNTDGAILDLQYVDKGSKPVDPTTREDNPIDIPTMESTVKYDYTFTGWDTEFVAVFGNQTITAVYSESLRNYTVKYVSKNTVLQETVSPYGTNVFYEGDIPVYVAEESAYKYYLFERWDKSGYVDGDKTINAVYDTCSYSSGYFDGKDLSTMRPVEIYALTKIGIESSIVESMDDFTFTMGGDYDYDDIESNILINESTSFTGKNYVDTGISVMNIDRDFVLAVDYEFGEGNSTNATLMQCFKTDGSDGFKLLYNSYPRIQWGTSSNQCATGTNREMIVLRHVAGETGLHVYTSNLSGSAINYIELTRTKATTTDSTLVFGCVKADDGAYENYAIGTVHWAKLWFADLGENACKELASYIHEDVNVQMCGFKRKYLSDGSSKRSSMSFLASHTLRTKKVINNSYSNEGGWAECSLNTWLNTRFYNGLPISIKQLVKQVKVNSSIGKQSSEISSSDCYIYIPAIIEVYSSMSEEPYVNEDTTIDYMVNNSDRIRKDYNGTATEYWTRSPNKSYDSYYYYIKTDGGTSGFGQPAIEYGIVIEFSI